jgi:hypothetical protein
LTRICFQTHFFIFKLIIIIIIIIMRLQRMPRYVLVLTLLAFAASLEVLENEHFCVNVTGECIIDGRNVSLTSSITQSVNFSIVLINSHITAPTCELPYSCDDASITLSTPGNISLVNSSIAASVIFLTAAFIEIGANSMITVAARGPLKTRFGTPVPSDGQVGHGGGHGGTGADVFLCRALSPLPSPAFNGQGFGFSTLDSPYDFGGSSSSIQFSHRSQLRVTRGGGILWLSATIGSITIAGNVCADGGMGESEMSTEACQCQRPPCACGPGGGAGGSVNVVAGAIIMTGGGTVSAVGGDSADSGGGGGGIVSFSAPVIIGASQVSYRRADTGKR